MRLILYIGISKLIKGRFSIYL